VDFCVEVVWPASARGASAFELQRSVRGRWTVDLQSRRNLGREGLTKVLFTPKHSS